MSKTCLFLSSRRVLISYHIHSIEDTMATINKQSATTLSATENMTEIH